MNETHTDMVRRLQEEGDNAQQAIADLQDLFTKFDIEDVNLAESPFGKYITIDIDVDEAQEFVSRVYETIAG